VKYSKEDCSFLIGIAGNINFVLLDINNESKKLIITESAIFVLWLSVFIIFIFLVIAYMIVYIPTKITKIPFPIIILSSVILIFGLKSLFHYIYYKKKIIFDGYNRKIELYNRTEHISINIEEISTFGIKKIVIVRYPHHYDNFIFFLKTNSGSIINIIITPDILTINKISTTIYKFYQIVLSNP
jgi:hypothetical protein